MNFSSIFFPNLVNLQLSVSNKRMLLHSTDLKFIFDCVFKPEVIVLALTLFDFRFFFVFRNLQVFTFSSHIITLLTVLISHY